MADADLSKSIVHILEELVLGGATTVVTVPSITDPDTAFVDEAVAGAAFGDLVVATPIEALPANASFLSAYVVSAGNVRFVFSSVGGNVTGADTDFNVSVLDRS